MSYRESFQTWLGLKEAAIGLVNNHLTCGCAERRIDRFTWLLLNHFPADLQSETVFDNQLDWNRWLAVPDRSLSDSLQASISSCLNSIDPPRIGGHRSTLWSFLPRLFSVFNILNQFVKNLCLLADGGRTYSPNKPHRTRVRSKE